MGKQRLKRWGISLIVLFVLLGLLYWKLPRPLSSYVDTRAQIVECDMYRNVGGADVSDMLYIKDPEQLNRLVQAVETTRVRHLNRYQWIELGEKGLYSLFFITQDEQGWREAGALDCDEKGFVYMDGSRYAVFGRSELYDTVQQVFETGNK